MATHQQDAPHRTTSALPAAGRGAASPARPARVLAALGLATASALAVLPGGTGHADPQPTIQEVEQRTADLDAQVDQAVEDYEQAEVQLVALRRKAQATAAQVTAQQQVLARLQVQVGKVVAASYRSAPGAATSLGLLTSSSSAKDYLAEASALDHVAAGQAEQIAEVATARSRLDAAVAVAQQDLAVQRAVEQHAAQRRADVEGALAQQRDLLSSLKAEERARLEAERRAQAERERAAAEAARRAEAQRLAQVARDERAAAARSAAVRAARSRRAAAAAPARAAAAAPAAPALGVGASAGSSSGGSSSGGSSSGASSSGGSSSGGASSAGASSGGSYSGPASGRASVAVAEAYRRLGSPYQWGASGPSTFDCSGLTAWVWARAGVFLPHSSRAQASSGRPVSQGELAPGDLVFYGSPIHHVGIYVGGGNMISAPHTGTVVKVQPAFRSDYAGAVRP